MVKKGRNTSILAMLRYSRYSQGMIFPTVRLFEHLIASFFILEAMPGFEDFLERRKQRLDARPGFCHMSVRSVRAVYSWWTQLALDGGLAGSDPTWWDEST